VPLDALITTVIGLGGLSSLLTSVVTRAHWAPRARVGAAVGVSTLVGASGYLATNNWHVTSVPDMVVPVVGVITASVVSYQKVFQPLGLSAAIEKVTTLPSELAAIAPASVPVPVPVSSVLDAPAPAPVPATPVYIPASAPTPATPAYVPMPAPSAPPYVLMPDVVPPAYAPRHAYLADDPARTDYTDSTGVYPTPGGTP
jgi:hypothetical protein